MPKEKKNRNPSDRTKRKIQAFKDRFTEMNKRGASKPSRQFKSGQIYTHKGANGILKYFKADKRGAIHTVANPNQGRAQ